MFRAAFVMLPGLFILGLPVQAAVFTVTKTADTLDGACDRDCSLREAVTAANAEVPPGDAHVIVVPPGIYALTRTGAGEDFAATGDLDLNVPTMLVGAGAGSTVIDGNGADRVLDLRAPAEIDGVTIRNGRVEGDGGGLLVRPKPSPQPVLLRRSVVSGNRAQGAGGGIAAPELSALEIRDSAVLENQAGGDGGNGAGNGGGIAGVGFRLANVTVSDNRAEGAGGGLFYELGHGESISSSTIVFNQAGVSGGGIGSRYPLFPGTFAAQVSGSIVAENFAPQGRDCWGLSISLGYNVLGVGEGCSAQPTDRAGTAEHPLAAVFRVQDTRLGPTPVHALLPNSPALDLVPHSLCEPADQLGQVRVEIFCDAGAVEKPLAPVCLPGGSVLCLSGLRVTATLDERFPSRGAQAVPLTVGTSIDTGNFWFFAPDNLEILVKVLNGCALNGHLWVFASGLTDVGVHLQAVDPKTGRTWSYDHAAGTTFPPRLDTDAFPCPAPPEPGVGGEGPLTPGPGEVFRVTRTSDGHEDGACDQDCSLREAVVAANARPSTSVIVLGPGVYTLSIPGSGEDDAHTGDLDVTAPLVILGAGAKRTILDGGGIDRVLDVRETEDSLELHDLTVRNGWSRSGPGEGGGGIQAAGPLTLVRCAVDGNRADGPGGGILALDWLDVRDSTVSGNRAGGSGGGLASGLLGLENVTISGNQAGDLGGGISSDFGLVRLVNVTVTGNSAAAWGGGIAAHPENCVWDDGSCWESSRMERTIVAGNTGFQNLPDDCFGLPLLPSAFNRFGVGQGCDPGPDDVAGTASHPLDPRLSPLADHGGPTLTHLPLPGSPVLDAAPAYDCIPVDQRGLPRPSGGCDAGAVELQPSCEPDAETLCIGGGGIGGGNRFRITVRWTAQGRSGTGKAVPLALDTGAFWFFDPANLELTVKVLDGCGVNGRVWVFLTGLTDVGVEVRVEDTATSSIWTHIHAAGTPLEPRLDTGALDTCQGQ
ncbi:MAG: choice-of-anchor Q domain-containing protein [Thermoanaerobaculia bacterium]